MNKINIDNLLSYEIESFTYKDENIFIKTRIGTLKYSIDEKELNDIKHLIKDLEKENNILENKKISKRKLKKRITIKYLINMLLFITLLPASLAFAYTSIFLSILSLAIIFTTPFLFIKSIKKNERLLKELNDIDYYKKKINLEVNYLNKVGFIIQEFLKVISINEKEKTVDDNVIEKINNELYLYQNNLDVPRHIRKKVKKLDKNI